MNIKKFKKWRYIGLLRSHASWAFVGKQLVKSLGEIGLDAAAIEKISDRYDSALTLGDVPVVPDSMFQRMGAVEFSFEDPGEYPNIFKSSERVGLVVGETDFAPEQWCEPLNRLPLVVVPSQFCKSSLVNVGVEANRITVIPHGVSAEFNLNRPSLNLGSCPQNGSSDTMKVLFVGTPALRKGLDIILKAVRVFSGDDRFMLTLKIQDYADLHRRPYLLQNWRAQVRDLQDAGVNIVVIDQFLPEMAMAALYSQSDVFCAPFRGEGFCLPILEAAASGCAIIATGWGGPLDFLSGKNAFLLKDFKTVEGKRFLANPLGIAPQAIMVEPSIESLITALATLQQDKSLRMKYSREAALSVSHLTWRNAALQLFTSYEKSRG